MTTVSRSGAMSMPTQFWRVRRWIERFTLTAGVALLLAYLLARIDAATMYRAGLSSFAAMKASPSISKDDVGQSPTLGIDFTLWSGKRVGAYTEALGAKLGTPLAVLSIPKLRLDVPVFEGTGELTLNRGAGRIVGTARPGEEGNMGIAAHRDGFFRGLKDIKVGDRIELATPRKNLVYTVDNISVVKPSDVSVLRARPQPSLTLVTCYPFYFVGEAPQRYIVQASLADSKQATASQLSSEVPKLKKEKTQ